MSHAPGQCMLKVVGAGVTPSIPKVRGALLGNLDILWKLVYNDGNEYCGETLRMWAEVYGPTYDMNILWGHQHILTTDFDSFGKGHIFREMFDTFLGAGIFTTDGDMWKSHRTMARPFFAAERLSDLWCFETHTSATLEVMLKYAEDDKAFDIQARLVPLIDILINSRRRYSSFTLDAGVGFLFGQEPLSSAHGYQDFSEAFNNLSKIMSRRLRIGSNWRLFEMWRDPTIKFARVIHEFVEPIIQARMLSHHHGVHSDASTFLDYLLKSGADAKAVRDELLNFLLAARDTTTSLLTFTTYILASHPDIAENVRNEINRVIGERDIPTLGEVRSMKYLRAVINEVLRLFPPVPFNIRRCLKSSVLPSPMSKLGPFTISAGVSVTYSPLLIQRRKDLWGESAHEFDPQRWLRNDEKPFVTNPFAFLPFNGGPRMCMGQQFAYIECSYVLIRMLRTFKSLQLAPDVQPASSQPPKLWLDRPIERLSIEKCWPKASLTLHSEGGLWIRAKT
ncbi:cytochrome P450 monooxygenase pc-3 [Hysterangium stoloniferum]|nr:cytochrome P450 monooxygenase pc-3 [Hysterangium stoloniferum]